MKDEIIMNDNDIYLPKVRYYDTEDTIIINFGTERQEFKELKKVCKELDMKIARLTSSPEIFGHHYLILILDPDLTYQDDIDWFDNMSKNFDVREVSILFTRKCEINKLPSSIRRFIIKQPDEFNYDNLKLILLNKRTIHRRIAKTKTQYDRKLFRMMYILTNLMYKQKKITTQGLCNEFNVSEKTIYRDILMLRSLENYIEYDKPKKEWQLVFSIYKFDIDFDYREKSQPNEVAE